MRNIVIFILIFKVSLLHAADMSHFSFDSSVTDTRDHFTLREQNITWLKNRRYPGWDYTGESPSGFDYGFGASYKTGSGGVSQFTGINVYAIVGQKWSPNSSSILKTGIHQLKNKSNSKKHSTAPLSIEHNQLVGKWLNSRLAYVSDWNYQDLQLSGAIESFTRKKTIHHSFLITPSANLRISLRGRNSEYTDENSSYHQDLDIKYKIGPTETWYLIGAGVEYTRFEQDKVDYWTPHRFLSLGPRLEIVQPFAEKFQIALAANLNRFQDESSNWGDGFYTNLSLQYGKRENTNMKVGYERIQSRQSGSIWYSDRLFFSFNYFY